MSEARKKRYGKIPADLAIIQRVQRDMISFFLRISKTLHLQAIFVAFLISTKILSAILNYAKKWRKKYSVQISEKLGAKNLIGLVLHFLGSCFFKKPTPLIIESMSPKWLLFCVQSKSNTDLMRALFVFRLCTIDTLVQHNQRLLQAMHRLVRSSVFFVRNFSFHSFIDHLFQLGTALFARLLKLTFYGHFVAGENLAEVLIWFALKK